MKKKWYKKGLGMLLFTICPVLLAACGYQTNAVSQTTALQQIVTKNDAQQTDQDWDLFTNQPVIQSILQELFGDDEDKKSAFLTEQKTVPAEFISNLQAYLLFGNNISTTIRFDGLFPFFNRSKPFPLSEGEKVFHQLLNEYWLWFLFHIPTFSFANYLDVSDLFRTNVNQELLNQKKNALVLGQFYKATNHHIVDFTKQVYSTTPTDFQINYYFMNADRFIFELRIDFDRNMQKRTRLSGYITTFPLLFQNEQSDFDLKTWIQLSATYQMVSNNETAKLLYQEKYGNQLLKYTLVSYDHFPNDWQINMPKDAAN